MDWTVLGIKETKDKKEITKAYRERLKVTNPEDSPEAFMELRKAYEEALAFADKEALPENIPEGPIDIWMSKVKEVYGDYRKRLKGECWEELLRDDVCVALDKKPLAEKALLEFFLEKYNLPQNIWILLNQTFAFEENKDALYEQYPKDFVDFVILEGIRFESSLPYDLFEPGINASDCDDYRSLYYKADRANDEEMVKYLEQMDTLSEKHPYGEALKCIHLIRTGQKEEGQEAYLSIALKYPQDTTFSYNAANIYFDRGEIDKAKETAEHVLSINPSHYRAKKLIAECLAALGKYDEAKEAVYRLYDAATGNQREYDSLSALLKEWNDKLISGREERLLSTPEDGDNALELGWCYLQNDRETDAYELIQKIDVNTCDEFQYHNLYSKILYSRKDYENAITHFKAAAEISKNTVPDGTDETDRKIKKLPEFLQLIGSCCYLTDKKEEGEKYYEEAIKIAPNDPQIVLNMALNTIANKDYAKTEELARKLIDLQPMTYHSHYLLAQVCFDTGRDREAYEEVNRALNIDGGEFWGYILKLRILERNGVWEDVKELVDFLENNGVKDALPVLWFKARLAEEVDKDFKASLDVYNAMIERLDAGEELEWAGQAYFNAAILIDDLNKEGDEKNERFNKMAEVLDRGIKKDPENANCLDYRAWIYKMQKDYDKSMELYKKLEEMPDHRSSVDRAIADLYYRKLSVNAKPALEHYLKIPEWQEDAELLFYIGTCYRYLYDFDNAEKIFLKMQELDPSDVDGWRGLSFVYESENRFEEALQQAQAVIDKNEAAEKKEDTPYYHKIRLLRRLKRPLDALETVNDLIPFENSTPLSLKFDIMTQFGMWKEAEKLLDTWKNLNKEKPAAAYKEVQLPILMGDIKKAKKKFFFGNITNEADKEKIKESIAALECDYKTLIKIRSKQVKKEPENSYNLLRLAEAQVFSGDKENAAKTAEKLKEILEKEIPENHRLEALYRTRHAMALAILGSTEEAKEELKLVRSLPLCENCDYCSCKDADMFEAYFAEMEGDLVKAKELTEKAIENWPDDEDFKAGLNRLEKKNGKK